MTGKFLKTYLYDTITNSQIVSIFKRPLSLPNIDELENIGIKIESKKTAKDINWEELRDPFINSIPLNTEDISSQKKPAIVN
ncbi:MAG: hypothetical protein V1860_02060 [bacterium]